jgi:vancomycin permeability regulator SanA
MQNQLALALPSNVTVKINEGTQGLQLVISKKFHDECFIVLDKNHALLNSECKVSKSELLHELKDVFGRFGDIKDFHLLKDKYTYLGHVLVRYHQVGSALDAIGGLTHVGIEKIW